MSYLDNLPVELPVTVAEAKAHLRIDTDADDNLLQQYILASTQQAEHILQREIMHRSDPKALADVSDEVPQTVKQYILVLTGDMYNHREMHSVVNNTLTTYYKNLLDPYILYFREDEDL